MSKSRVKPLQNGEFTTGTVGVQENQYRITLPRSVVLRLKLKGGEKFAATVGKDQLNDEILIIKFLKSPFQQNQSQH